MAKTATELSIEKIRSYCPWRNLERLQKDPEVSKRREHAWNVARIAAELLKTRYGATQVVVFGSLVHKTGFTPWSDVDLAVWGITPEEYYSAAGSAMDLGLESGIKVDVVDTEDCAPEFLADIEIEGIEL